MTRSRRPPRRTARLCPRCNFQVRRRASPQTRKRSQLSSGKRFSLISSLYVVFYCIPRRPQYSFRGKTGIDYPMTNRIITKPALAGAAEHRRGKRGRQEQRRQTVSVRACAARLKDLARALSPLLRLRRSRTDRHIADRRPMSR